MTTFVCEEVEPVSKKIKKRIEESGFSFRSNDSIASFIKEGEKEELLSEVEQILQNLFDSLVIDTKNDHNTRETPKRVAKMFINEVFRGRYEEAPSITNFPNVTAYDQLYVTGPITVRSTCAHHLQNIRGRAYIGIFPGKNVVGLSKFNRIVDWIASRPQIQEEMTQQIADEIEKMTEAEGVAVLMRAEHFCMTQRGVREHESDMTTAVMRGKLRDDKSLKDEFYHIVAGMK